MEQHAAQRIDGALQRDILDRFDLLARRRVVPTGHGLPDDAVEGAVCGIADPEDLAAATHDEGLGQVLQFGRA
ncbi:MAG: hypothetical protein ACK559_11250, partial [bacterium]